MFKRKLSTADIFTILVNLVPLWGVWFSNWDPKQIFLIYCAESIIVGLYNILKMLIVTQVKKKDVWDERSGTEVSGYFFILFFLVHYGFFVALQLMFFLGSSHLAGDTTNPIKALAVLPSLMDNYTRALLWGFVGVYGLRMIIDFIFTGEYRRVSLGLLMFSPYARIFIQQFVVIIGGFILTFGAGKIFMLVFVAVKLFFEVIVNYERFINLAMKKQKLLGKKLNLRDKGD